jgi:hypothetical protein
VVFEFDWKTKFKNNYFNPLNAKLHLIFHLLALLGAHHILHVSRIRVNYVIFYHNWYSTIILHFPSLIAVERLLFIKSHFTTNVRNALSLRNCTQAHVWSWPAAKFQKYRVGRKLYERRENCVGEECVHSQLDLSAVGILSVLTVKNLKGLQSARCLLTYIDMNPFACFFFV